MSDNNDLDSGPGPGVSSSAVSAPVNVLELLDGMEFPASKMEIISYAEDRDASEEVLDQLQAMPDDVYDSLTDVNRHFHEIEIIEESGNVWGSGDSRDLPRESDRLVKDMDGKPGI